MAEPVVTRGDRESNTRTREQLWLELLNLLSSFLFLFSRLPISSGYRVEPKSSLGLAASRCLALASNFIDIFRIGHNSLCLHSHMEPSTIVV